MRGIDLAALPAEDFTTAVKLMTCISHDNLIDTGMTYYKTYIALVISTLIDAFQEVVPDIFETLSSYPSNFKVFKSLAGLKIQQNHGVIARLLIHKLTEFSAHVEQWALDCLGEFMENANKINVNQVSFNFILAVI